MRALDPEVVDTVWAPSSPCSRSTSRPIRSAVTGQRVPDRDCFEVMLVRLVTGCSWEDAERLCGNKVSDTTARAPPGRMGEGRRLRRRRRRGHPGLRQDHRPRPLRGRRRRVVAQKPCWRGRNWQEPDRPGQARLEVVDPDRRKRHPDRLGRRAAPTATTRSCSSPPSKPPPAAGLLADIETIWLDRGYDSGVTRLAPQDLRHRRRRHRQEPPSVASTTTPTKRSDGAALAGRAHQLVAVELRPARGATPTARPTIASLSSPSRWPSCSPPSSSTGGTAGHQGAVAYPLNLLASLYEKGAGRQGGR